ncbi:ABC transporter permease [Armatimonas sp.]|uniref:ABC transporter permease n=1 Tax=Armatimonas sp. TaxID=1872638 RepID=UPI00286CF825|nr:ABC transporter permease [Armatimonas sp.]
MSLLQEAREAWRYRELLGNLVQRELDVRYKNSKLGVAWSLANPIVRALILAAVFTYIVPIKTSGGSYFPFVVATFFPWTYFLTGILDAGDSVSKHLPLVRKVYFPRELLPLATTIANLRHFLLTLVVVVLPLVLLLYVSDWVRNGTVSLPPAGILLLPLLVLMQTLLIGGIALFLSALNVFFEDVKFLTAVALDLLFYAVPIIYFLEQVQHAQQLDDTLRAVVYHGFLLNPIVVIVTSYRAFLLHPVTMPDGALGLKQALLVNQPVPWPYFVLACLVCLTTFMGGYAFFNSRKWRFVEQT